MCNNQSTIQELLAAEKVDCEGGFEMIAFLAALDAEPSVQLQEPFEENLLLDEQDLCQPTSDFFCHEFFDDSW